MDKQREMFEAWAKRDCCTGTREKINFSRIKYPDGKEFYQDASVETAWQAWQAAIAAQWQPIETAPLDGQHILAFTDHGVCEAKYDAKYYLTWEQVPCGSELYGADVELSSQPTHWMPLPPEPTK